MTPLDPCLLAGHDLMEIFDDFYLTVKRMSVKGGLTG